MAPDRLLPLFPLELVLLPGAVLPLHIFEERYRLMIGEVIEQASEFGVVLWKDGALASVGCSATVERVVHRYPDGRLDILAVGRRRFEILLLDETDSEAGAEAAGRLWDLFQQARELLPSAGQPEPERGAGAFRLAAALPLELDFQQTLLASHSEAERVALLSRRLEQLLPRLRLARRVGRSARGNGKGRR